MDPVTGSILALFNSASFPAYLAMGYGLLLGLQKLCDSLHPIVEATATESDNKALAAVERTLKGVTGFVESVVSFFALRGKK